MNTASRQDAATRAQRWALGLASVASFMVMLDLLVVATALSTIRRDLGASIGQLEWTINAYTLAFAVLLMTAAAVGDRFGRRRVFAIGLGVFAAGSAACALAPGAGGLIAARTVQGVGAAMVMPLALALLNAAVPPQRRGWAMGIFGSVTALAVVVGPVLGGAITQGIAWQWIFWLNVPIGLLAIPLALRRLQESYGPRDPLALPGVALATGAVFFMAQFLQVGLGQDPLGAGLRLLPWGVAPLLIAPRAGKLADRIGERPLVVSGMLLLAAGFAWIAIVAAPGMAYPALLAPMIISSAGLGLAVPAVTRAVVGSVPRGDIGKASGSFTMMRQLGGAFGVAIAAAVFAAAGGYTSAAAFSAGLAPAFAAATGLALAWALIGLALPGRPGQAQDAPAGWVATVRPTTVEAVAARR